MNFRTLFFLSLCLFSIACETGKASFNSGYTVVNKFPHDKNAFTQGLEFRDGFLYESTGQYDESTLRKVELQTGKVVQKTPIPPDIFAEGMTIFGDKIYQISWRERTAFMYQLSDFKLLKEFSYQGEGWGLTNDGKNLYMSDGTHVIRVLDPENFSTVRTISVNLPDGKPLAKLNELEWVKGEIWANIWHSESSDSIGKANRIVRINPNDGKINGWINLDGISPTDTSEDSENVLNGIAYDAAGDRIFVTGKNWKNLYEIKLKAE